MQKVYVNFKRREIACRDTNTAVDKHDAGLNLPLNQYDYDLTRFFDVKCSVFSRFIKCKKGVRVNKMNVARQLVSRTSSSQYQ